MQTALGWPMRSGSSRPTSTARPTRISYACRCPARPASPSTSRTSPPTPGSLKHRLARSLFLYGLCNGWIGPRTTIVEASSGSTAVSRGLFRPHAGPALHRRDAALHLGREGRPDRLLRRARAISSTARRRCTPRARAWRPRCGGHYMDQFTYAERATDWRGNNNIAESIFAQMAHEEHPVPAWIVVGAGTGGTSATLGRFIRYRRLPTRLCLADPETSVFHRHLADRGVRAVSGPPSLIEGIGRPRCEPSFIPELIDRAYRGAGRREHRGRARPVAAHRAVLRRIDRHQSVGRGPDHRRDGGAGRGGARSSRSCATRASATAVPSWTTDGSSSTASTSAPPRRRWSVSSKRESSTGSPARHRP